MNPHLPSMIVVTNDSKSYEVGSFGIIGHPSGIYVDTEHLNIRIYESEIKLIAITKDK